MALNKISTSNFEAEDEGNPFAEAPVAAAKPAEKSASTAVAVAVATTAKTAVAVQSSTAKSFNQVADTIGDLKNAMPVTFDMLTPLIATNGNICKRADKRPIGAEVTFELLSWQDSFVVSTGDDKSPKDLLRYSDDGVVCSDGSLVQEHLRHLRDLGYAKAAVKQRAVVVGSLISCQKPGEIEEDELVQFDLSPQTRASFMNYAMSCINKQRLGKLTADQVTKVKATANVVTMNGNPFTKLTFSAA
jgi:hypothetical protein